MTIHRPSPEFKQKRAEKLVQDAVHEALKQKYRYNASVSGSDCFFRGSELRLRLNGHTFRIELTKVTDD